jgi:hypothetical protein
MMNEFSRSNSRLREEMRSFLDDKRFTHFISLALNDPMASVARARRLLREWDARTNRVMLGKRWRRKPDERMNWIAFLEAPRDNPHWHLLVQLLDGQEAAYEETRGETFSSRARVIWREVSRSGTLNYQIVEDDGVKTYVTKQLANPETWENFVVFWEFFEL